MALQYTVTVGQYNNSVRDKQGLNLYLHFTLERKKDSERKNNHLVDIRLVNYGVQVKYWSSDSSSGIFSHL